jgi:hypothetical protein
LVFPGSCLSLQISGSILKDFLTGQVWAFQVLQSLQSRNSMGPTPWLYW